MPLLDFIKSTAYTYNKKRTAAYAEELYVALQLSKSLPHGEYAIISDLLLPNDGPLRTSQIDHIIVSTHGIFCIETKSHRGWIVASKARHVFDQVLYRARYPIAPNPVFQNNNHIRTLKALLGPMLKGPIVGIVVFPSAEKFFINGYSNVGSVHDMLERVLASKDKVYTYTEAADIIELICRHNFKKPIEHVRHVERIREVYAVK